MVDVDVDVDVYAYFSGSVAKLGWLLMQCVGNAYQHIVGYYITKMQVEQKRRMENA